MNKNLIRAVVIKSASRVKKAYEAKIQCPLIITATTIDKTLITPGHLLYSNKIQDRIFTEENLADNYSRISNKIRIKILGKLLIPTIKKAKIIRVMRKMMIIQTHTNKIEIKHINHQPLNYSGKHLRTKQTVRQQKHQANQRFLHLCNNNLQI